MLLSKHLKRVQFSVLTYHVLQTIKSHDAMAGAMKGVTKALTSMNKKMDLPGLQKIMADFMRENEKSEITQEALGDAMDDAMEEEGSSEQEDIIVNQVPHYVLFLGTDCVLLVLRRIVNILRQGNCTNIIGT